MGTGDLISTFSFADTLLIAATIAGPVLAVQAQKWIERGRDTTGRKKRIFEALMGTRATRVCTENLI